MSLCNIGKETWSLEVSVKRSYLLFSLLFNIKMSAVTIAERLIATDPAGINNAIREFTSNLPNG